MNIYCIIKEYLDQGKSGILATVIRRNGSAPRDVGAKMFVREDGKTFGTVGGGQLESESYIKSLEIMNKGLVKTFGLSMNAQSVKEEDMLCGGNVEVLLEPVTVKYLNLYKQIENCIENRVGGVIVTGFDSGVFTKTFIDKDLNFTGDEPDAKTVNQCKDFLCEKQSVLMGSLLFDPLPLSFPLYLFGAGHVSQCLSKIAKIVNFHITVIDDRKEFANKEKFPDADEILVKDFNDAFNYLDFTGNEYVVILTRSHAYDAAVLGEVVKRPVKYMGMIGSRRKVNIILDHIKDQGFDAKTIEKIHAPIGISIQAETPEEIAVSIAAQIITVRNM